MNRNSLEHYTKEIGESGRREIRRRVLICLFLIYGCFFVVKTTGADVTLRVKNTIPVPNYELNADSRDRSQLTDGRTTLYPMWTKRGSVGWSHARIVKLFVSINEGGYDQALLACTLRLHIAKRVRSEIYVPARIDVYSEDTPGAYRHAGAKQIDQASIQSNLHHWIDVDVSGVGGEFVVVMHAFGQYIILDEIELRNAKFSATANMISSPLSKDALNADSLDRLKRAYRAVADAPAFGPQELSSSFGADRVVAWVESPWSMTLQRPVVEQIRSKQDLPIHMEGSKAEKESGLIGLVFTGTDQKSIYIILDNCIPNEAVRLFYLKDTIAGNGVNVFDILEPMESDQTIALSSERPTYIWISADLGKMPIGLSAGSLLIMDEMDGLLGTIPLHINVFDLNLGSKVHANAWAYDDDRPIWRFRSNAARDLLDHCINVFVIHHRHIPEPSLNGKWNTRKVEALRERVEMYKGNGLILLYLEWQPGVLAKKPSLSWLSGREKINGGQKRAAIQNWVRNLSRTMHDFGLAKDEWALYVIDEIRHSYIGFFKEIVTAIKQADPEIRIYANPINTSMSPTSIKDLERIRSLVDIWQPQLGFAEANGKKFFQSLNKDWWIYSNPSKPAKAASPLAHYRLMSWRAWMLGAKGVGFWSYSDTWGSSTRDDFDGPRPDWAVVYEGPHGPVSSRRWEAFREGIEDLKLLVVAETDLSSNQAALGTLRNSVKEVLQQPGESGRVETVRDEIFTTLLDRQ